MSTLTSLPSRFSAPEPKAAVEQARQFIERAEALGEPLEDPLLLFSVLYGSGQQAMRRSMETWHASSRRNLWRSQRNKSRSLHV